MSSALAPVHSRSSTSSWDAETLNGDRALQQSPLDAEPSHLGPVYDWYDPAFVAARVKYSREFIQRDCLGGQHREGGFSVLRPQLASRLAADSFLSFDMFQAPCIRLLAHSGNENAS